MCCLCGRVRRGDDPAGSAARPCAVRFPAGLAGRTTGAGVRFFDRRHGVLLVIGATVCGLEIAGIRPAVMSVTRMVAVPIYVDGYMVRNQFLVRFTNKRAEPMTLSLAVQGLPAGAVAEGVGAPVVIGPLAEEIRPLVVQARRGSEAMLFPLTVVATDAQRSFTVRQLTAFLGPESSLLLIVPVSPRPGSGPAALLLMTLRQFIPSKTEPERSRGHKHYVLLSGVPRRRWCSARGSRRRSHRGRAGSGGRRRRADS